MDFTKINMKKLITLILVLCSVVATGQYRYTMNAGEYAISTLGNTTYVTNTTRIVNWPTEIDMAMSYKYVASGANLDTLNTTRTRSGYLYIGLEPGGTFTGTLTIASDSVKVGRGAIVGKNGYKSGANPVISGFTTISGWTDEGGGIYSKTLSVESPPNMVTINDSVKPMGRFPNTGYRTITGVSGSTQITDATLTGTPNWTGAEVVIRKNHYIIERAVISNHSTTTLTFTAGAYSPKVSHGYFIQNSLSTLDTYGEWYYGSGKIYVFFGAVDPTTKVVKVSSKDKLIYANKKDYITVKNIAFEGANVAAVNRANTVDYAVSNFLVQNCDFNFSGKDAIYCERSAGVTVNACTFDNTNNIAVHLDGSYGSNNSIKSCTINNTGLYPGLYSGSRNGMAIRTTVQGTLIEKNTITNTGYIPIYWGGTNSIIQNNFIDTYAFVLDDAGGIYCWADSVSTNKQVLNNIVLNGIGAAAGTFPENTQVNGLYSDGNSKNITYSGNTVGNVVDFGYHNNIYTWDVNNKLLNNTFYNVGSVYSFQRWFATGYAQNLVVKHNEALLSNVGLNGIFKFNIDNSGNAYTFYGGSLIAEVNALGVIDSNFYFSNADIGALIYSASPNNTYNTYTFDAARSTFTIDSHSTSIVNSLNSQHTYLAYNNTFAPKTVALAKEYQDKDGTVYATEITLPAWGSKILFETGVTNPLNALVSTWKLDESSGSAVDAKGVNNLTYNAGVTQNVSGKIGTAYSFNGTTGYMGPVDAYKYTTALTVSVWFKSTSTGTNKTVVANYFTNTGDGWHLTKDEYGRFAFWVGNAGVSPIGRTTAFALTDQTIWNHCVATFDGTNQRIYINGVKVTTGTTWNFPIAYNASNRFTIGKIMNASQFFEGEADNVSIWNAVLTDAQVKDLYYFEKRGKTYPYGL